MPLAPGNDRATISRNIAEMIRAGYPQSQAVAASLSNARRHPRADGGAAPYAAGGMAGFGAFHPPHVLAPPRVLMRHPHAHGAFNRPGFAFGGADMMSPSEGTPWWTRSDARQEDYVHPGGLVASASGGRSDRVPTAVAADSYILPADVVSGLGEGNSLNGSAVIDKMLHSEPFGIEPPRVGGHGVSIPRPPRPMPPTSQHFAAGGLPGFAAGRVPRGQFPTVPVRLSGGEYVVLPTYVKMIGHGDVNRGHDILDAVVKKVREHTIKKMKSLPGPKRD